MMRSIKEIGAQFPPVEWRMARIFFGQCSSYIVLHAHKPRVHRCDNFSSQIKGFDKVMSIRRTYRQRNP
jgi:hypothetical protein